MNGHDWTVPFGLNVSASYSSVGWQELLDLQTTWAATDAHYNRMGKYQGGDTYMLNRWRSEQISCMIDNRFYFSTFQRELIVKRIMSLAGDTFTLDSFKSKEVTTDPVRDMISSSVMGKGDPVAPRPMPLLPPPVLHTDD